jgi:transposase InsO family protein
MAQSLHQQARTTHLIRAEIQASSLCQADLARKYNVSRQTIRKWKSREVVADGSHRPHKLDTTLTHAQELIVIELRKTLLLATDDLLVVTREFINPTASRSGIGRLLRRYGVSDLKKLIPASDSPLAKPKTFKEYEPGFLHIDIKYLPRMPDEEQGRHYLFVAIDRATRWVFVHIYPDQTELSATDFLKKVESACPFKIKTILTDNGTQFTDRFTSKNKEPSGNHSFDKTCVEAAIDHRLIPPRHPQTNGMVERFNGRITEIVSQTRFSSLAALCDTLRNYVRVYNHSIPQRALKHQTPVQALKLWQTSNPELFNKRVYDHRGLDI